MTAPMLHILNARGQLGAHLGWLEPAVREVVARARGVCAIGPLDIVLQTGRWVIPEKGHVGTSPRPGLIYLTVDPDNPAFPANENASFERMVAHELHHAARWDGPGYGRSLGEALVSEGLAGHFVLELFGGPPEPWETALDAEAQRAHCAEIAALWDGTDHDHGAWFFGRGSKPRWLGYAFGFGLVGRYLAEHPRSRPSTLARADAAAFRPMVAF